jgi:hypothetical protein
MGRSVALKAGSSPVPRGTEFGPPRGLTSLDGARSLVAARESFACRLLAGIDRRGITDKRAARDAGTHPSTFKRLRAGLTTRVDCALVAALARTDRAWLDDVFGPALDDNGQPFVTRAPVSTLAPGDWPAGWSVLAPALAVPDPRRGLTQAGLLDRAAIYRVEPHAVTTLWLGSSLRTEADALGRSLAARADRRFAARLERDIRALTETRVTRFVDVVTAGVRATWRRLAVPNGLGLVTHIVEFEKIEELG